MEEFLNERGASILLGVSEATLRRWVNRRLITVYHTPTRRRRYKRTELVGFLETLTPMEVK